MAALPAADGSSRLVQNQGHKLQLVDKVGSNYMLSGSICRLAVCKSFARTVKNVTCTCLPRSSISSIFSSSHLYLHFPHFHDTVKVTKGCLVCLGGSGVQRLPHVTPATVLCWSILGSSQDVGQCLCKSSYPSSDWLSLAAGTVRSCQGTYLAKISCMCNGCTFSYSINATIHLSLLASHLLQPSWTIQFNLYDDTHV
jgi:hypothetical protein